MRPRFVRTQREMEGRFEDVWALVDEDDDLETWPEEAELEVVGRPATRQDGPLRTSGAARYTVDVALPGMLEARVVRAPVARCRVTNLDLDAARAVPGVRAVLGPERAVHDGRRSGPHGRAALGRRSRSPPSPPTRGTRWPSGIAALALDVRGARRRSTSTRPRASSASREEPRETVRGDPDAAIARRRGARRAELRDARARPDAARAARRGRALGRRPAHGVGLDAGHVRRAARARCAVRASERERPRDHGVHRRRLRRQAGRGRRGAPRGRARAGRRPAGAPRQRPPRGAARRRPARADAPDRHASARAATGRCWRSSSPRSSRWAPAAGSSPSPSPR